MIGAILLAQAPDSEARAEGWLLWIGLVLTLALVLAVVTLVRRMLIRPMPRSPSDTSDAWSEAGRRMPVPPPEPSDRREGRDNEESP
jgi:hypothetical protein